MEHTETAPRTPRRFDVNDALFLAGVAIALVGAWQVYPPGAQIGAGLLLAFAALRRSR